jgi:hypothetical protein
MTCMAHGISDRMLRGLTGIVIALGAAGCSKHHEVKTTAIPGPYDRPTLIAVAPPLNFSGSSDFDPIQVADLFASELSTVEGLQVIGVNRVIAVLARDGQRGVASPGHALEICRVLGCDGIVVFAVTEYDAYTPVVGLAVQLYMLSPRGVAQHFDPVVASRQASPFPIESTEESPLKPRAQVQKVYNAAHNTIAEAVRRYAESRSADEGAMSWRKYLKSQRLYIRYCCWSTVNDMMGQEYHRMMAGAIEKE